MQAELRSLHSPDALDMENFVPEDPDYFCILVQALIGPKNGMGSESFDFLVCTPRWLEMQVSKEKFVLGAHYLFIEKYDYNLIWQTIYKLCQRISGPDWNAVASILAQYGSWEFDNYTP